MSHQIFGRVVNLVKGPINHSINPVFSWKSCDDFKLMYFCSYISTDITNVIRHSICNPCNPCDPPASFGELSDSRIYKRYKRYKRSKDTN